MSKKQEWIPSAIPFFLFGFVYYLISPAFVYSFISDDNETLYVASKYLESSYFDAFYYLDAFVILGSFLLGYASGRLGARSRSSAFDYGSFQTSYPLYFAIMFGVLIVYFAVEAYLSGARLFTGYSTYNIQVLGPFSTAAFMTAWFVNYFSKRQVRVPFLLFFIFSSVLLLGWGSRMFFVLGVLALVLGVVSQKKQLLKSVWLYSFITLFCLLVVMVGITRQGGGELSADKLLGIFFAEPLFTSISGWLYLENLGGRPIYGVPSDVFASIIHFVPSAVFPGKGALMSEISFDENVVSPFGARSLIVSLYSNFGRFYPLFIAAIGFYFGFLFTKARASVFYRATYFSALPVLLLLFFRDGLATVLKVLIFNGLLVPIGVSLTLIWFSPRTIAEIKNRISRNKVRRVSASENFGLSTRKPRQF